MGMDVKQLSDMIAAESFESASFFPVDREFLEVYIDRLQNIDKKEFILYNIERVNNTYTIQLFLCLPELWEDITINDLIELMKLFTNVSSFFSIIEFTYKYIEIDIIELIFRQNLIKDEWEISVKDFLKNQYTNLVKTNGDFIIIEKALNEISYDSWIYIKQKFLLDKRIKPALNSVDELEIYLSKLFQW